MLESNYPSKTFLGVRFVLLGFEPVNEEKIRSKLVSGGGVDVGQYKQNCTHVIVDKLVYYDPACVAAREDGKMVVSAIWVDHSYDVGMPLDTTSVMYRPRKDLNGIPGARNLIMCLTGYQRQDREDIMTMVGLMGAQFSKPLVAHKVTHLICYKFEGEKYELAKKMKIIKLVNHRWLEDCLMEWNILPEANYEKSGYELEMMEAEAKDSEDESKGTDVKQFRGKSINKSPHDVKTGTTKLLPDATTSRISVNVAKGKDVLRTPIKDNRSPLAAKLDCLDVSGVRAYQHVPAQRVETFGDPTDPNVRTPDSTRVGNDLASASINAEKSSPSDLKSALSYSRKTPRRTSLSMYYVEKTINLSRSPRAQSDEFMIDDCSNGFLSKLDQLKDCNTTTCATSSPKGAELLGVELNNTLPQKRKMDNSSAMPMSSIQKTNCDAKPNISGDVSFSNNTSLGYNGLSLGRSGYSAENFFASASTTKNSSLNVKPSSPCSLPFVQTIPGLIDNTDGKLQKTSSDISEEPASDRKGDTHGFVVRSADVLEEGKKQDKHQDVDRNSERSKDEVSHIPLQSNGKEGSNNVTRKPLRQKTVGKKSLGSRSKLCKAANGKGSIYLNEIATQNDADICLNGGEGRTDLAKSFHSDKFEVSRPTLNIEAVREVVQTDDVATPGDDMEKKIESMDDETEAPDDQYDHDFGKAGNEADIIIKEQPNDVQVQTSNSNETMLPDIRVSGKVTEKVEPEKAESSKISELGESASKVDGLTYKTKKKRPLGMTRITSALGVKENRELEGQGKSMTETREGKEGGVSQLTGKTKKGTVVELNDLMLDKIVLEKVKNKAGAEKADCVKNLEFGQSVCKADDLTQYKRKGKKRPLGKSMAETGVEKEGGVSQVTGENKKGTVAVELNDITPADKMVLEKVANQAGQEKEDCVKNIEFWQSVCKADETRSKRKSKSKKCPLSKTQIKSAAVGEELEELKVDGKNMQGTDMENERRVPQLAGKTKESTILVNRSVKTMEMEKENKPVEVAEDTSRGKDSLKKSAVKSNKTPKKTEKSNPNSVQARIILSRAKSEPVKFILSGHRLQRKEFQQVIRRLKGKVCRDSHQWSYEATHFIAPDPIRRTEKFFAAAASGRWILKMDYLTACNQAGKFLDEEPYEWHKSGFSEDGAINLEAPRKWRLLRERTGHGAFYGLRIIIYGECVAPPLDTLKRAVKAGDGTILATSPPYNRFLNSGVDFAIVSPGMPRVDMWIQEFIRHEIPCVAADYLVEYVCKPGYSLEKHVLYSTHTWAETSFANLLSREETIVEEVMSPDGRVEDITCQVCGSDDRGDVMLICGNESGSIGCGAAVHIDCCDPALESVPQDDWFCQSCAKKETSSNPSRRSKKRK